jgi:predicted amidohydrolase
LKIAVLQVNSGNNGEENLSRIVDLCTEAMTLKPDVIALPEYSNYMGKLSLAASNAVQPYGSFVKILEEFATTGKVEIICGILEAAMNGKAASTVYHFQPDKSAEKIYTKIHLFDIDLENNISVSESDYLVPGVSPGINIAGNVTSGFAVCYDLRFPELFRYITLHGAKVIYVPSAFTEATGKDHWEILLRARAIENQVFIVAPDQVGEYSDNKVSYGHSMIVDPWGKKLAEAPGAEAVKKECIITAEIDFENQAKIRHSLPALHHIKLKNIV